MGQWELISDSVGTNIAYYDMQFINEDTGFITGGKNGDGVVFRTYDSGMTWDTISVENVSGTYLGSFAASDIYFCSDSIGYLLGEYDIVKTIDGGDSWFSIDTSDFYLQSLNQRDIIFLNKDTGFICWGDGGAGGIRTFDGGLTWENDPVLSYGGLKFNEFNGKFTASGALWYNLNLTTLIWNIYDPISYGWYHFTDCININNRVIVVGSKMGSSGDGVYTYTDDYGASWRGMETPASIDLIYFYNENLGFMSGWLSGAWRTTDGGETWYETEADNLNTGMSTGFKKVQMVNDTIGFAISLNGIYKTQNTGGPGAEVQFTDDYLTNSSESDNQLKLFPNPVSEQLTISGVQNGSEVYIYSLDGQLIHYEKLKSTEVDLSRLNNGAYIMNIKTDNTSHFDRIIVKH